MRGIYRRRASGQVGDITSGQMCMERERGWCVGTVSSHRYDDLREGGLHQTRAITPIVHQKRPT